MNRDYDVNSIAVLLGGIPITEFADGDAVSIAFDDVDFVPTQGSHGSTIRSRKHNNLGKCTLSIMQGSPALDILQSLLTADRLTGLAKFSFMVKDMRGNSLAAAPSAWFEKTPDLKFATEASAREWVIVLAGLEVMHGQNYP
ncbi:MAG: phage protein [Patescibacteria group bacterium]|jgi:hypothetical protein